MEKTLNMGAFEALDNREMMEVDGGIGFIAGLAIGVVVGAVCDGICISATGKSMGEWASTGINAAVNWVKSW